MYLVYFVVQFGFVLVGWRFDQRQFDGRAHIQHGRDGFVDWAGFEFLDGGVFGRIVLKRVLQDQHDRFEQDA